MKKPAPQLTFSARFKSLLKKVTNTRQHLVNHNLSGLHKNIVQPKIDRLKRYLNYNLTDEGAAEVLKRNHSDIAYLIPNNAAGLSLMTELENLKIAASMFTKKETAL